MELKSLVDTVLKKLPIQAKELPDGEKFEFKQSEILEISQVTKAKGGHLAVTLTTPIKGTKDWFAFGSHVTVFGNSKIGVYGTDSLFSVDSNFFVNGANRLLGGAKPAYWGRYFSGIDFTGFGEYTRRIENNILRSNGIRVLPIGRFTTQVKFGRSEGKRDGRDQANDFLVTFGEDYLQSQGREFYFFLDTEPEDPLSTEYYIGWSQAVASISSKVKILPCVYLGSQDRDTSSALAAAINQGAECHGLWVARYDDRFRKDTTPILEFNTSKASPATDIPSPVLFWQFAGEIGTNRDFDFSVSNPDIDMNLLLKRLVIPQPI